MSSISVVDGIQLSDVNKSTLPQGTSIEKNQDNDIYSTPESSHMVQVFSFQDKLNVVYPVFPDDQTIDFSMDPAVMDNYSLTDEDSNKIEKLKGFASFFIPVYTFFKNVTPEFTLPEALNFNFTPITHFFDALLSTVSDTCVSIYDTGERVFNATIKFIKDTGKSVFDASVDFGKSVISTVTGFYDSITSSSDHNNTEIKSNNIISTDNAIQTSEQAIEDKDLKKPYWFTLKTNGDKFHTSVGQKFQNHFNELSKTVKLNDSFLFEGENSVLQVNGQKISKRSPEDMLTSFKYAIPNLESRQLISSYSHLDLFSQPYIELFSERPELADLKLKDMNVSYVVDELNNGTFQLVATSKSQLDSSYKLDGNTYDSFGVQTSMILSKDHAPNIEYAYFLM
ncbi:MAG: hypothetical protein UAT33_02760 [Buchnera aphidicola (Floraphis choui)]